MVMVGGGGVLRRWPQLVEEGERTRERRGMRGERQKRNEQKTNEKKMRNRERKENK